MNGIFDLQNPKFFNNLSGPIPDIEEAAYELDQEGKLDLSNLQKFSKALGQAQYNLSKPRLGPFSLFDVGSLFLGGPLSRILTGTSALRNISNNYPVGGISNVKLRDYQNFADYFKAKRKAKEDAETAALGLERQRVADRRNFDQNLRGFFSGQRGGEGGGSTQEQAGPGFGDVGEAGSF